MAGPGQSRRRLFLELRLEIWVGNQWEKVGNRRESSAKLARKRREFSAKETRSCREMSAK
jgi:hypothetical protein